MDEGLISVVGLKSAMGTILDKPIEGDLAAFCKTVAEHERRFGSPLPDILNGRIMLRLAAMGAAEHGQLQIAMYLCRDCGVPTSVRPG